MSWGNSTTPRGADDGRKRTGHRVLFDRETHVEAWMCARVMKRLKPEYQKAVRLLAESFLVTQLEEAAEKGGA